ncbi:unnamed protein product [Haemonchus placei]|uniref:PDZ domain-containing protein n=1 Tax=Haemonchus placei TaxID=6290 RepID=A0A0N4WLD0_HAEPC|nr:unnamed protein product [Haemonchus placei]
MKTIIQPLSGDWTQVEVIRLSTEGGGLGFGIVGGTSTGVVVKTILPGSPADKQVTIKSNHCTYQDWLEANPGSLAYMKLPYGKAPAYRLGG